MKLIISYPGCLNASTYFYKEDAHEGNAGHTFKTVAEFREAKKNTNDFIQEINPGHFQFSAGPDKSDLIVIHFESSQNIKTIEEMRALEIGTYTKYLKPGDQVGECIHDYFLECIPPAFWDRCTIQMGEPYDHDENNRPRYMTLQKINGNWTYAGIKRHPKYWGEEAAK